MVLCTKCQTKNRREASYCKQCGAPLPRASLEHAITNLNRNLEVSLGLTLNDRYRMEGIARSYGEISTPWSIMWVTAKDTQTGAQCVGIPISEDVVEARFIQELVALKHRALPNMEIVEHRSISWFIGTLLDGQPLDLERIRTPSLLIYIGLQLCDFFEATGSQGMGFGWPLLQMPHVHVSQRGQVLIDVAQYCRDWLHEYRLGILGTSAAQERRLSPVLALLTTGLQQDEAHLDAVEAAEVEAVGSALTMPLIGAHPIFELKGNPLRLRESLPGIPLHLEQAMLGASTLRRGGTFWITSLSQLRQHLLGLAEGPARVSVNTCRIEFGSIPWGEVLSGSIQLSSLDPGLFYGKVMSDQPSLRIDPSFFIGSHPMTLEVRVAWDTSLLEVCGSSVAKVRIETGCDLFEVTLHADVQTNAQYFRTQAERHLRRQEWEPALQHSSSLLRLQMNDAEGYLLRAQASYGLSKFSDAVKDYTTALRITPNSAGILNQRGVAYMRMNRLDLALKDYSGAILLEPHEPTYYWNRSVVFEAQGCKDEAVADLKQYISLGGLSRTKAEQRLAQLQSS